MVTPEIHKESVLVSGAAKELLDHVEELLHDVVIELLPEHFPARRAAALYDPIESDAGQVITFQLFQHALEDLDKGTDSIFGIRFDGSLADEENNNFAEAVQKLRDTGMSLSDALGAESGAGGLDTLAEGMIPGFVKLMKSMIPDLPGLDSLTAVSPISDYMSIGMTPEASADVLAHAAVDAVDRAKGYLKSSVGIQSSASREIESSPRKLVNASVAIAMHKSGEPSPARIWQAWAIYPEILSLHKESKGISEEPVTDRESNISFITSNGTVNSNTVTQTRLSNIRDEIREYAVLLTACMSRGDVCCLISILTKDNRFRASIKMFRSVLSMGNAVGRLRIAEMTDYTKFFNRAKSMRVSSIIRKFDRDFFELVDRLQEIYEATQVECISFQALLDIALSILFDLRKRVVNMLRKFSADIEIQQRHQRVKTNILFKNLSIGMTAGILDEVEAELDFAARCRLDLDSESRLLVRIAKGFSCHTVNFTFHLRGQPMPSGIDPDYPLLNLDPVNVAQFKVAPGIQGPEIPTDRFEELFKACREGKLQDFDFTEVAPAKLKRR